MHGLPPEDTLSLYVDYAPRVARPCARLVLTPVPEILSSAFLERASEQLPWFAGVLLISVCITSLFSRERRATNPAPWSDTLAGRKLHVHVDWSL